MATLIDVEDLTLRDRVTLHAGDDGWVTGTVVELALLGDDAIDTQITLRLDNGTELLFERHPGDTVRLAPPAT